MKAKLVTFFLALACLVVVTGGTVSFFSSEKTALNVITAGNIGIDLLETSLSPDGDEPVSFISGKSIMPGAQISKIVCIKNTGDFTAYVRVRVSVEIVPSGGGELLSADSISLDLNKAAWAYKRGYYYYRKALPSGAQTEPLFTIVSFDGNVGNEYQGCTVSVSLSAYAVQTDNNGDDPITAAGWPA